MHLLKEKSEVAKIFKNFYSMVHTQFNKKIQIFWSDNGREFFNSTLEQFFLKKDIVHQSSCTNTPQQNGIVERKNRYLLKIARALLFATNVPHYLWGEAILTATHLINRMPSKILNFKTFLHIFTKIFPTSQIPSGLPI